MEVENLGSKCKDCTKEIDEVINIHSRSGETIILAFTSLVIAAGIILLILLIFIISGYQNLLIQMLQSTAEGDILGVAFTAGGPFGMWVIAFILIRFGIKGTSIGPIKVFLAFSDQQVNPPSQPAQFKSIQCWYSIFSNGRISKENIEANIQKDKLYGLFIWIVTHGIENPEIQVTLKYNNIEWISDSFSPNKRTCSIYAIT